MGNNDIYLESNGKKMERPVQNPILTELEAKECSDARRNEILAELKSKKEETWRAHEDYASALAFCLNRESDWEHRLTQLKELRKLAKDTDATPKTILLYVQCVYHRLNAETEMEQKQSCCETLYVFCKSAPPIEKIHEICTRGILNTLRQCNHPILSRRYRDQLWSLLLKGKMSQKIVSDCISGLEKYTTQEKEHAFQLKMVSKFGKLCELYPENAIALKTYAKILQLLIFNIPEKKRKNVLLERLKDLANDLMERRILLHKALENGETEKNDTTLALLQAMEEVQHEYAIGIIGLICAERTVKGRLEHLGMLEMLAKRPDPFFQEAYTQGMVELLKHEKKPEFCIGWLEQLKKRVDAPTATEETIIQYVVGLYYTLKLVKDVTLADELMAQITYWHERVPSLDVATLHSCALLIIMRRETDSARKHEMAHTLVNWKTDCILARFGDMYHQLLCDYLEEEEDFDIKEIILPKAHLFF